PANQPTGGAAQETKPAGPTAAQIAAAAHAAAIKGAAHGDEHPQDHVGVRSDEHALGRGEGAATVPAGHEDGQVHAFPEDSGPWSGDDASSVEATEHTEPAVEVESEVPDAVGAAPEPAHEPAHEPAEEPVQEPVAEPAPVARGRRRRGRVVAPAGPPRHASAGGDGAGSEQA
ncbi:hypothetical protein N865_01455, partial [Intrasporangium oryzae NRRL B-24470]